MGNRSALIVLGTRPQFIKSAPLIKELVSPRSHLSLTLVHSGQHYDPEMSSLFFSELKLPRPNLNLRVGSGSHASQTATIMLRLEKFIKNARPDVVIVPGDTNTTLAAALVAAKCGFRVAHLEAGLRSGDMSMPEEINRRLTDHCSALLFAPTRTAVDNLAAEGLSNYTRFTGDTMVDAIRIMLPAARKKEDDLLESLKLDKQNYALVTLHRPSNVDDTTRLSEIMRSLRKIARRITVVFPVHPRTRGRLRALGVRVRKNDWQLDLIRPQGYIETLALLKNARCLLTDSGGMQKEAFLLRVPCVTLRSTTEWPETLVGHANRLIVAPSMIFPSITQAVSMDIRHKRLPNPFGRGKAAQKIRNILEDELG